MPKEKSCEKCALCEQVYSKGGYGFYPENFYLCAVTENFTDKNSVCERWREQVTEYDISSARFQKAEEDVSAILRIFKEKRIRFLTLRRKKRRSPT